MAFSWTENGPLVELEQRRGLDALIEAGGRRGRGHHLELDKRCGLVSLLELEEGVGFAPSWMAPSGSVEEE